MFEGNCLWPRPDTILQDFYFAFFFSFFTHVVGAAATKTITTALAIT